MRKGDNKSRKVLVEKNVSQHRVLIPVYIPHEKDYYKDAFEIFKLCLQSIKRESVSVTPITVVANGCSQEIHDKLLQFIPQGLIDELFIETKQLGKINSLRKAIKASEETYLTISDGDVLFLNGWDSEVARVFTAFPHATAVAPVPIHKTFNQYVSNIWFDHMFSGKLAFAKAENPAALEKFVQSIGWPYLEDH
ncbi:glycosyltransferase family 2 protein [Nonlabens antarcticus]|uniref:glycosyltransferase family 2 protein n=1 Tax=Nonlabens antarcticus TaxID=392714 RepID=UPI00189161FF|nr:glycosyltransferase family 2 protein [Nonlabens antarcticus]